MCLLLPESQIQPQWHCQAFLPSSIPHASHPFRIQKKQQQQELQELQPFLKPTTSLNGVVADPPSSNLEKEEEEKNSSSSPSPSWIPINGGFLPNIPKQIQLLRQKRRERRRGRTNKDNSLSSSATVDKSNNADTEPSTSTVSSEPSEQKHSRKSGSEQTGKVQGYGSSATSAAETSFTNEDTSVSSKRTTSSALKTKHLGGVLQVTDILGYKQEVVDVKDRLVAVRFYAPWCKACRAVERPFRRLAKEFPTVKFVEVPVTKENGYLHQGLGIPSLPFAHLYYPGEGNAVGSTLVEEMKINKHVFADFKQKLQTYVDGECPMVYDEDGENQANTASDDEKVG